MRPVQIALQLIETLAAIQPAGVSDLARLTGLPKSTAQRALNALHKAGWIESTQGRMGVWTLSMKAMIAAGRGTQSQSNLRNIAIPVMEELRRATGETIHLMVLHGFSVVLIERLYGILPVEQFRVFGSDAPLNLTATGKAILAAWPREQLNAYLKQKLPQRTATSVADPDELRAELARVRARGYATTFGANRPDVGAVAAAILDSTAMPFAAISASGPLKRMTSERCEQYGLQVADAARRISMGAMWQKT